MAKKQNGRRQSILRIVDLHFLYTAIFGIYIVVYHAGNVLTLEAVQQRWMVAVGMLFVTTLVWYATKRAGRNNPAAVWVLVAMDILVASYMVYAERGMQSLGVALYTVPIATSAVLANPPAVFATASLATAAYFFAAVKYFTDFFNEGYKIQLYGTLAFYSAMFFVLAACLVVIMRSQPNKE